MIVLDADVLLFDIRYGRDPRFAVNKQVLDYFRQSQIPLGITCQTLLEILGVCTFNLRRSDLSDLADQIPVIYRLAILPDPSGDPSYVGASYREVRDQIANRLSLGDSVTVLQLRKYIPQAVCFLTWNARHFQGQLAIPALTPEEWWRANQPRP